MRVLAWRQDTGSTGQGKRQNGVNGSTRGDHDGKAASQSTLARWIFAPGRFWPTRSIAGVLVLLCLVVLPMLPARPSRALASAAKATATEAWAQERICAGDPADFNTHLSAIADPRRTEGWDDRRLLGSRFLVALISGDLCKIPARGVDIIGAWVLEPIDLQGANIAAQLRIRGSRFDAPVQLDRVRAEKLLSFAGSHFAGRLLMTEIAVRGSLFLGDGASFDDKVVLWGASVDGQASFSPESIDREDFIRPLHGGGQAEDKPRRTRFADTLELNGIRVTRILDLRNVDAEKDVLLDRARVDGDLRLSGAHFGGSLSMDSIRVGESVEAWGIIWGNQEKDGPCTSALRDSKTKAYNNVTQDNATNTGGITAEWRFYYASIGVNFYLSGACLADLTALNLSGSRIGGQLFLGSIDHYPANAWGERSILILRNASIGKIQDTPSIALTGVTATSSGVAATSMSPTGAPMPKRESWPLRLELDGFTYASWDGLDRQERPTGSAGRRVIPARGDPWLIEWLARDHSYSRQPYEQLARVMTTQGKTGVGNDLLFTSREIERCIAVNGSTSAGIERCILQRSGFIDLAQANPAPPLSPAAKTEPSAKTDSAAMDTESGAEREQQLLDYGVRTTVWLLNGYGYRPLWSMGWFMVLIMIGSVLFRYRTEEGRQRTIWFATEYTFDTLLPAVNLCKEFDSIRIDGPIRYYFIALKVLGYVFVATLLQVFYQVIGQSIT